MAESAGISGASANMGQFHNAGSGTLHAAIQDGGSNNRQYHAQNMTFAEHHARPKTPPPSPCSTVPFEHDPDHIPRPDLLEQIDAKVSIPRARVAIVGLGGTGKTQLAVEYAAQVRKREPSTWVLWIHASSAARFEQSVKDIAEQAGIRGRDEADADVLAAFGRWLRDARHGKWLLILDNVDDGEFLFAERSPKRLIDYLPACDHGSTLVTSRIVSEAQKLVHWEKLISVDKMDEKSTSKMLHKKLGPDDDDLYRQLAAALDHLPLAISQAAAYIRERGGRESVASYLRKIRNPESHLGLLQWDPRFLDRDHESSSSILLTWQISFRYLHDMRRSAADLLALMSFCDRQSIPEILIRTERPHDANHIDDSDRSSAADNPSETFEEDILALRKFSFISATTEKKSWEMHRLVQVATQMWLEKQDKLEAAHSQFLHNLDDVYPYGSDHENWPTCETLFPHASVAMAKRPIESGALLQWANVMCNAGWYSYMMGSYADARAMALIAREALIAGYGYEHSSILDTTNLLVSALAALGRYDKAIAMGTELVELSKTLKGPRHGLTLSYMSNLADNYREQGKLAEAEQLQLEVVPLCKEVLGPDDAETLRSMQILAIIYCDRKRWQAAESLQLDVVEAMSRILGSKHPDTLGSRNALAIVCRQQGKLEKAEEVRLEELEDKKEVFGPNHTDTLISTYNLALIYKDQERWIEAEGLLTKVIEGREVLYGPEDLGRLKSMDNLAYVYRMQKRLEEAEQLLTTTTRILESLFGSDNHQLLLNMAMLSDVYWDQKRYEEAEKLLDHVVQRRKAVLGDDHSDTQRSISGLERLRGEMKDVQIQLAYSHWSQEDYRDAGNLYLKLSRRREELYGGEDAESIRLLADVSLCYWEEGRHQESQELFYTVLQRGEMVLGEEHPLMQDSVDSFVNRREALIERAAKAFRSQEKYKEAGELYLQLSNRREVLNGIGDAKSMSYLALVSDCYWEQDRREESQDLLARVIQQKKVVLGAEHADTQEDMRIYDARCQWLADVQADLRETNTAMREMSITSGITDQLVDVVADDPVQESGAPEASSGGTAHRVQRRNWWQPITYMW